MEENDPRVRNSQEIPPDKDFDLAAENGKLKEKIKELEIGLRNGEKIAEERIAKLSRENKEPERFGTTVLFLLLPTLVSFGIILLATLWAIDYEKGQERKIKVLEAKLKVASEKAALAQEKYIIENLEKEKVELKASAEKAKAEAADLRSKFDAERAELQKKLDEISATTAAEKASRLAKQKKAAEELVRSWCGVPVVNAPAAETSQSTAPDTPKTALDGIGTILIGCLVGVFVLGVAVAAGNE